MKQEINAICYKTNLQLQELQAANIMLSSECCPAFRKWASLLLPYSVDQLYDLIELFPTELCRHMKVELAKINGAPRLIRWSCFFSCTNQSQLEALFPNRTKADALILSTVAEYLSIETSDIPNDPDLHRVEKVLQHGTTISV